MKSNPFHKKTSLYLRGFIGISIITMALLWTGNSPYEERVVIIRYLLFILSGFIAFSMPYLLFPDSRVPILQLGNVHNNRLIQYFFSGIGRFCIPVILFFGVILFGDLQNPLGNLPGKTLHFLMASGLFGGLILLALSRYLKSGSSSQFWKESPKGREMRQKAADYFKFPLDPGSIPSLINTVLITFTGMFAVVASAVFSGWLGPVSEMLTGLIIFSVGILSLYNLKSRIEQNFYQSNAFYREFFGTDLKGREEADVRKVEQLWWVPRRLKPHVWQFVLQLDRVVPAGRVVGAGHILVWFIAYQKPDPQFIFFVWLLFAMAHQFFTGLTLNQDLAPHWLLRWIDSVLIWFLSRFWMQLRWILPMALSMNMQLFIFGTPDYNHQAIVILAYLIFSMLISSVGAVKLKKSLKV
ncbi:MAG: hypothetical protein WEA56_12090 [Balneolaceae bacterium]